VSFSHAFSVEHAARYGVDGAILLTYLGVMSGRHVGPGTKWVRMSAEQVQATYPYWTEKQVRRILAGLVEAGVVIVSEQNSNRWDRTKSYALTDEFLQQNSIFPNGKVEEPEPEPQSCPNGEVTNLSDSTVPLSAGAECTGEKSRKPSKPKAKKSEAPKNPEHNKFIDLFFNAWGARFGAKYAVSGPDAAGLKRLLGSAGKNAEELMAIVQRAWNVRGRGFWACENKTKTIAGFCSAYNDIVAELHNEKSNTQNGFGRDARGGGPDRGAGMLYDDARYQAGVAAWKAKREARRAASGASGVAGEVAPTGA